MFWVTWPPGRIQKVEASILASNTAIGIDCRTLRWIYDASDIYISYVYLHGSYSYKSCMRLHFGNPKVDLLIGSAQESGY